MLAHERPTPKPQIKMRFIFFKLIRFSSNSGIVDETVFPCIFISNENRSLTVGKRFEMASIIAALP